MNPSLDVHDVFRNPGKAIATLKAGEVIDLIDDDGKIFARVLPAGFVNAGKRKSATKKTAARKKSKEASSASKK